MGFQQSLQRLLDVCLSDPRLGAAQLAQTGRVLATEFQPASLRRIENEIMEQQGRAELQRAMVQVQQAHAALSSKPELAPQQLVQLGVLSGLALTLSAEALRRAAKAEALAAYTIENVLPWLCRAVSCGILGGAPSLGTNLLRSAL